MAQVQGGQDISKAKSRTKEVKGMALRDLGITNLKEPGDHLDVGNGKIREGTGYCGGGSRFPQICAGQ